MTHDEQRIWLIKQLRLDIPAGALRKTTVLLRSDKIDTSAFEG